MKNDMNMNPAWLQNATDMECEKCKSVYFKMVVRLKKISKIISATPQDILQPISVYACAECGHVNADFDIDKEIIKDESKI